MLLTLIVFVIGMIRSFFTQERTRKYLAGKRETAGNVMAALLGIVTPFCSCSAVPLFLGFVQAGVPLGVTFSFLIAAPMVNEIAVVLLYGLLGWKIAAIYLVNGLMIAIISGWVIGRFKLEHWIEDWVQELRAGEAVIIEEKLTWADRIGRGREAVRDIVGKVWIYVVAGIGVGAAIHGYVPETFMASIMGKDAWWSVPAAVRGRYPHVLQCSRYCAGGGGASWQGCRTWYRAGLYDECYRSVTAGNGHSPQGTQTKTDCGLYRSCWQWNFIYRFFVQSDYLNQFCRYVFSR